MYVILERGTIDPMFLNEKPIYASSKAYAKLVRDFRAEKGKKYRILKSTDKVCPKCGSPLFRSFIKGYTFQCFTCDEDFYKIEVR